MFLRQGIERLSLVGGLADAITQWLTPDLRERLRPPNADAAAGAALAVRHNFGLETQMPPNPSAHVGAAGT